MEPITSMELIALVLALGATGISVLAVVLCLTRRR